MSAGVGTARFPPALTGLVVAAATACGPGEPRDAAEPSPGVASPAIFGGVPDADDDGAVVALRVGAAPGYRLCTGALVGPNVVLTARHCTSVAASDAILCGSDGRSTTGTQVLAEIEPADIGVFTGASPALDGPPRARGLAVVRPEGAALCDADVALVVLDRALGEVTPLPLRLDAAPLAGETVRSVGYGENDDDYRVGVRYRRDGVAVLAVGAGVERDGTVLGGAELEASRATCQGDSGGPAISEETGAVVGVASRGPSCALDYGHVYARTDAMRALILRAFAAAGGAPVPERPRARPDATSGRGCAVHGAGAAPGDGAHGAGAPREGALLALALLALRGRRATSPRPSSPRRRRRR